MLNRGAISTPARPANSDDRAQAKADTRSAATPLSSVIRGLSTTARIRRPMALKRKRANSPAVATTAMPMVTSSLRLNEYTPKGS